MSVLRQHFVASAVARSSFRSHQRAARFPLNSHPPIRPASMEFKPGFGYVVGTAAASYFIHHMYMSFKVVKARKEYKVEYPALYASDDNPNATAFNCVQRAHQNSLENQPIFLALLTLSGLQYPVTASTFGALYLVGRIGYFAGYSSGDPKKRINSLTALGYVGIFGLVGTAIKFAVDLLK